MTTTVSYLLDDLRRRGAQLKMDGERLIVDAPRGAITQSLVAELRTHKAELLEALNRQGGCILNSHNSHNRLESDLYGNSEDSENLRKGGALLKTLRDRIHQACDWQALVDVLNDAQMAFVDGVLIGPAVEALAGECRVRAREIFRACG